MVQRMSIEIFVQGPSGKSDITRGYGVAIFVIVQHAKQFAVKSFMSLSMLSQYNFSLRKSFDFVLLTCLNYL